jgi:hypothetical protein
LERCASQELLVIRRNHKTGEVSLDPLRWGLISTRVNKPENDDPSIIEPIELRTDAA